MMEAVANPVIRLWLAVATGLTCSTLLGILAWSRALEQAFRDSAERHHPTQPNLVLLASRRSTRTRLNVIGHQEGSLNSERNLAVGGANVVAIRAQNNSGSQG